MARYSRLDYTSRDFDSILVDLHNLKRVVFPDWTDDGPGNPGNAIIECVAYTGDLLAYYQDRQVNEAFLITANERQNVINHLRTIGYELSTATPSSTDLTLSPNTALAEDYTLPRLSVIQTIDGTTVGETQADVTWIKGSTGSQIVSWIEGATWNESIGTSTGQANQSWKLGRTPFLSGSDQLLVDGVPWTRVTNFLNSGPSDQHYVVQVNSGSGSTDDTATIFVGDGVNGMIPANGAVLTAIYRTGGGDHNVDVNLLVDFGATPRSASGVTVDLRVTNTARATGGGPRETIAHAKQYGPSSIKTNNRSVSKEDYAINAEQVSGVARAVALTRNEDTTIQENTVNLFIVPIGGGTASSSLLAAVREKIDPANPTDASATPKPTTTRLNVFTAPYFQVSFSGTVYCTPLADAEAQTTVLQSTAAAAKAALAAFFDPQNLDSANGGFTMNFGQLTAVSVIYALLQGLTGTVRLNLAFPSADLPTDTPRSFPQLAPMSVVNVSPTRVDLSFGSSPVRLLSFVPGP
jgi:hypothetical protein